MPVTFLTQRLSLTGYDAVTLDQGGVVNMPSNFAVFIPLSVITEI